MANSRTVNCDDSISGVNLADSIGRLVSFFGALFSLNTLIISVRYTRVTHCESLAHPNHTLPGPSPDGKTATKVSYVWYLDVSFGPTLWRICQVSCPETRAHQIFGGSRIAQQLRKKGPGAPGLIVDIPNVMILW